MRRLPSIVLEIDRHGRYLDRVLRVGKLNKLAWVEFRHMVKVVDRLMVNLTDFNALHFRPSSLRHRKSPREGSKAAAKARTRKTIERKAQNG
jgi:hypothetical protein